MTTKLRKITALALSAMMIVSLSGCGNTKPEASSEPAATNEAAGEGEAAEKSKVVPQEKVSIVLATNWCEGDSKYDYFYPKFLEFQEQNKDTISISLETQSTEDYKTKIKTQTASGSLPDIFTYWGGGMMTDMYDAGLLLNVDDFFADSSQVKKENFEAGSFDYYMAADGNNYGIPIESTRGVMLVNKELFSQYKMEYPKTYEDLLSCGKVFRENDIIPMAIGSNGGTPSEFLFSEIYNQFEGSADEITALASERKFATDNAVKTAEILTDMIDNKLFPEDTVANGGWGPSLQLYSDGKAAMTYTYPWMFAAIPEEVQQKSDIIPMPEMPGASIDPQNIATGFTVYGIVINKASYETETKHDAMVKVIEFMTGDDLNKSLTESGMVPCKKIDVDTASQSLIMQKTIEYSEGKELKQVHYTTMPSADAITAMDDGLDELFIKGITPQEFVEKVQKVLDAG